MVTFNYFENSDHFDQIYFNRLDFDNCFWLTCLNEVIKIFTPIKMVKLIKVIEINVLMRILKVIKYNHIITFLN